MYTNVCTSFKIDPWSYAMIARGEPSTKKWHHLLVCLVSLGTLKSCCNIVTTYAMSSMDARYVRRSRRCILKPMVNPRDILLGLDYDIKVHNLSICKKFGNQRLCWLQYLKSSELSQQDGIF